MTPIDDLRLGIGDWGLGPVGAGGNGQGRPVAFVQVDLDGLWAVRRCYGAPGRPEQDDPVFSESVPAFLDLFDRVGIKATFFVVGADVQVRWKRPFLEEILKGGHEIANHSLTHSLGLGFAGRETLEREVGECQEALRRWLGVEARGFRAPGYAFSNDILEILKESGFWYDASLFPTAWGAVMRWIDRRISQGRGVEKSQYRGSGGARVPGTAAPGPFETGGLWEVPVSVSPRLRMPFHGGIGFALGRRWVESCVRALSARPRFINYVLHGIDVMDGRKWPVLPDGRGDLFFRGRADERLGFFEEVLRGIARRFEVHRTDQWVESARKVVKNVDVEKNRV